MAKTRIFHPSVAQDLSFATEYYDKISIELGNRFRTSVRDRLRVIAERPETYARIHVEMRAATIERFPYVILFEDHTENVKILGVFHAASDRSGWFTRDR